jgi:hypothetical protein
MIKGGELRLPEMQRRYIWPATRVRDLLDSLYRGYPSGTILVWETEQERPTKETAVEQKDSPFKGHKMLLDGQQRLTSLAAILLGEPVNVRGKKRPIEILFNLDHPDGPPKEVMEVEDDTVGTDDSDAEDDEEAGPNLPQRLKLRTFVVASGALLVDPHWVKVSDIFNNDKTDVQILKPLVKSFEDPLFNKYSKRLQAVRKIREYPYVMHVLDKGLSYEEVAEIFVRVNSLGIKLRGSDLALAQITSRWQGSLQLFEEFQEECEDKWFTLDLGLIVRSLVVFATEQSRFKTVASIPMKHLKAGWEQAKEGIRFSVNFLRANAGIEDESLLSSPMLLIVPGFYAANREYQLTAGDEMGLRRWLYIANARSHYGGSSETTLDSDLSIIKKGGTTTQLVDSLKQQLGRLEVEPTDFIGRGKQSALFPMTYLALKARKAKDWRTGLGLSLTLQGRLHIIEHHHVFPKAVLRRAGYQTSEINEIANMAFVTSGTNRRLSKRPADEYLPEVVAQRGKEALEAHCVPVDSALWKIEAYPQFLEFRRAALAHAINAFIAEAASTKNYTSLETVLKDFDALLLHGESEKIEFKASARWDYRENKQNKVLENVVAKTLAGFMNACGGVLVLGVEDGGKILGLDVDYKTLSKRQDKDGYEQFLVNLVSATMGRVACACVRIGFCSRDGNEVCIVFTTESPRPVYVEEGTQTRFYFRVGNTTQELSTKDSVEYIKTRWRD